MVTIRCDNCNYVYDFEGTVWEFIDSNERCPCCGSQRSHFVPRGHKKDLHSYVNYSTIGKTTNDLGVKIFKEDKNMKKRQKVENQEQKLTIYRMSDTSRGIFKVKDLEPTDMFVLVCDEEQNVYMAVAEEEPKYKTKKAVIKMASGELSWIEDDTLIHVYRRNGVELHVNEFEYPND